MTKQSYSAPVAGSKIGPFIRNSKMWRDIIDVTNDARQANRGETGTLVGGWNIQVYGKSTESLERGQLLHFAPNTTHTYSGFADKFAPRVLLEAPLWHSKIDHVYPIPSSFEKAKTSIVTPGHLMLAKCNVVSTDHEFCMIDPSNPSQLKTATAGVFGLVADVGDGLAVIDGTRSHYGWRFELTAALSGAPGTASAKLINWDGTEFAASCTITDKDGAFTGMSSGEVGYCMHVGNEFIATQAPCPPA